MEGCKVHIIMCKHLCRCKNKGILFLVSPISGRAYPGSEFVVANTLAKWKKLEPNEVNCSQGFSQKVVSTSCFVFNSLPNRVDFCCLLIIFANFFLEVLNRVNNIVLHGKKVTSGRTGGGGGHWPQ